MNDIVHNLTNAAQLLRTCSRMQNDAARERLLTLALAETIRALDEVTVALHVLREEPS